MSKYVKPCPRCGVKREVRTTRPGTLCRDCRETDPKWGGRAA